MEDQPPVEQQRQFEALQIVCFCYSYQVASSVLQYVPTSFHATPTLKHTNAK